MPKIVRYRRSLARAAFRAIPGRYSRPLTLAYRGYTHYRRYKRGYQTAFKVAKWAYKKRGESKAAKKKKIGEPPGTSNSKQRLIVSDDMQVQTRSMHYANIVEIPIDDENHESRNKRERSVIKISGFKYCLHLQNLSDAPLLFHYAIVAPKNPFEFGLGPGGDFFRDIGTPNRSKNFTTALTAQEFDCLPINTDKFVILKHKKFTIGPWKGSTGTARFNDETLKNWAKVDGYEKLNRQIRYDTTGSTQEANPVYFIYWCDKMMAAANSPVVVDALHVQRKLVTYFRETSVCC